VQLFVLDARVLGYPGKLLLQALPLRHQLLHLSIDTRLLLVLLHALNLKAQFLQVLLQCPQQLPLVLNRLLLLLPGLRYQTLLASFLLTFLLLHYLDSYSAMRRTPATGHRTPWCGAHTVAAAT
jgi:hypothetical protein